MNISYSRSESAPYCAMTSSGFTTFPRLLLILYARAWTGTAGSALSTNPSPPPSALATSPGSTRAPVRALVYSVSPRIMPWDTRRRNGSGVETTPRSYSTLCQKRA